MLPKFTTEEKFGFSSLFHAKNAVSVKTSYPHQEFNSVTMFPYQKGEMF
jgi:hypothetical protein